MGTRSDPKGETAAVTDARRRFSRCQLELVSLLNVGAKSIALEGAAMNLIHAAIRLGETARGETHRPLPCRPEAV